MSHNLRSAYPDPGHVTYRLLRWFGKPILALRFAGHIVYWPGDSDINYTSPWAGAAWKPNFFLNNAKNVDKFERISFETFWALLQTPDTGLMSATIYDYMDKKPESDRDIWYRDFVPKYRVLPPKKLPPGVEFGLSYTTITIHGPKYIRWLLKQFTIAGGKTKKVRLSHINESFDDDVDIVVNCTGINSRKFGGVQDDTVFPTRGQTVVVWAPHIKTLYYRSDTDHSSYVIPREDGEVILGGTFDENNLNERPDSKTAESIIHRCVELCPELTLGGTNALKIISHNVGRQPTRIGGIRLEIETRKNAKGKNVIICHNYGHHSYGYSSSWGSCLKAFELIEAAIANERRNERCTKL
ncbi:4271_t:CDS:2 [Cetraspora pellucida]|uniref:4271_t:CDS:1 n=1 Tax=Cetraspora pellucida TaxID=1433469 RepID=A0A9N9HZG8_9GLOM|nr:4271_t:CDS:2 [Cetraspora pellucida]